MPSRHRTRLPEPAAAVAYLGYLIVAAAPLAFLPGTFTHDDVLKRALAPTAVLLILVRVVYSPVRTRELEFRQDPTFFALAIAWGLQALSLTQAVNRFEGYWPLALTASTGLMYVCTVTGHVGRPFLRDVFPWAVIACAAAVAAYGLAQRSGFDPLLTNPARENPGAASGSTLGGTTFAGEYLALVLPLAAALALAAQGWAARGAAGAAAVLLLAHLGATRARGAWLGAACGLAFLLATGFLKRVGPDRRRALGAGPLALTLAAALAVAGALQVAGAVDWIGRLRETLHPPPGRDTGLVRRELWTGTERLIADHPLLGVGPGQYALAIAPYRTVEDLRASGPGREPGDMTHNDALLRLAETGAVGFLGVLLVALTLVRKFAWYLRLQEDRDTVLYAAGLMGGAIAVLAAGGVGNPMRQPAVASLAWVFLGVAELVGNPRPRYRKRPLSEGHRAAGICVVIVAGLCTVHGWMLAAADARYARALETWQAARRTPGTEEERSNRIAAAQAALKESLEAEAGRWEIWKTLGLAALEFAADDPVRTSDAVSRLTSALELHPYDAEAWNALGMAKRHEALLKTGDGAARSSAEGLAAFERAAAIDPVSPEPRANLSLAYAQDGLTDPAYDALLRKHPLEDAEAWFVRGHALARRGDAASADRAFAEAERKGFRLDGADTRSAIGRLKLLGEFRESAPGKTWAVPR
jgi:O-antigen ligase